MESSPLDGNLGDLHQNIMGGKRRKKANKILDSQLVDLGKNKG